MTLLRLTNNRLASLLTDALRHPTAGSTELTAVGSLLSASLPPRVLTSLLQDVTASAGYTVDADMALSLLRLNLAANVTHVEMRMQQEVEMTKEFEKKCEAFMEELQTTEKLRLESLHLEGVSFIPGLLSSILKDAPHLHSLQVSGSLAVEALNHLRHNNCTELHSLYLHSCTVNDEEVASALVRPNLTLKKMVELICSSENLAESGRVRGLSLRQLTIISPSFSLGGAMVLLRSLPHLQHLHYTWLVPVCESLRLLQRLCPTVTSYAISHLDLPLVSENVLTGLASLCPSLRSLEIEGFDSNILHLDALADFTKLTSLSLRLVPEPFIVSAVKAVGHKLLHLRIEYEECVCKLFSFAALKSLQELCWDLRSLELISVCLAAGPQHRISSSHKAVSFPELKRIVVSGAASSPEVLSGLLCGNKTLEYMSLDVNQDALTDHVLSTLTLQNDLNRLSSLHFGAGNLSPSAITRLLTLPSLAVLSINLKNFPSIPEATFTAFQEELRSSNCLCRLERLAME